MHRHIEQHSEAEIEKKMDPDHGLLSFKTFSCTNVPYVHTYKGNFKVLIQGNEVGSKGTSMSSWCFISKFCVYSYEDILPSSTLVHYHWFITDKQKFQNSETMI